MSGEHPRWSHYDWIEQWRFGSLEEAYCLSAIRALNPRQVLDRLKATDRADELRIDDVSLIASEVWADDAGTRLFVAVAEVDGWALMYEENGFVGVTKTLMTPVSERTTVVSHYKNAKAVTRFLWLEDGSVELDFEPMFASKREGRRRDDVVNALLANGFDVDPSGSNLEHLGQSIFALAESLTGLAVTGEKLDELVFAGGVVDIRRA